jgi:hypothetical protein
MKQTKQKYPAYETAMTHLLIRLRTQVPIPRDFARSALGKGAVACNVIACRHLVIRNHF